MKSPEYIPQPLHPDFGVELQHFNLQSEYPQETADLLRNALDQHALVLISKQTVTDQLQIALAEVFGQLESVRSGIASTAKKLIELSNIADDGSVLPPSAMAALNNKANREWHSDSSFREVPSLCSVLSARVQPNKGGETEFICTRPVWRDLPESYKKRARGKVAIHDLAHSRGKIDARLAEQVDRNALPAVRQALVRRHQLSGQCGLFIGSHVVQIEDMPIEESTQLLAELTAFSEQPQFIYSHNWQPGDILIWDNRFTLHRGTPAPTDQPRKIVRATVAGKHSSLADMC